MLQNLVLTRHSHLGEAYFVYYCIKGLKQDIQHGVLLFRSTSVQAVFALANIQESVLSSATSRISPISSISDAVVSPINSVADNGYSGLKGDDMVVTGYSYHSNESSVNDDSGMLQRDGCHETVAVSKQCSRSVTKGVVTGFSSTYVSNDVTVAASAVTNMGVADMGDLSPIPSSTSNHTLFVNQVAEKDELLGVSLVPPTSLIQVKFPRPPPVVVEFGLQEEDEGEGATVG